jgi:hypothetical protein
LLGLGIVGAADELLRAWLDGERRLSRKRVVDLVMVMFDSIADNLLSPANT